MLYNKPRMTNAPATSAANLIGAHLRVADILTILPEAEELFAQNGLHCGGCGVGGAETLEEAAGMHSMDDGDLADLVTDLNILLSRRADRPQTITVTEAAADALKAILKAENKIGWTLQVGLDDAGGFSLDILEHSQPGDHAFTQHDLSLGASPLTLKAIGGSTVDFRDGRFKLDLPSRQTGLPGVAEKKVCTCQNGGECSCENGACGCS